MILQKIQAASWTAVVDIVADFACVCLFALSFCPIELVLNFNEYLF